MDNYYSIINIIKSEPRSRWKELISPLIEESDHIAHIYDEDGDCVDCFFDLESLDSEYKCNFTDGDFIKDSDNNIYFIYGLPELDYRINSNIPERIFNHGNTVGVIFYNETKKEISEDDIYIPQDGYGYKKIDKSEVPQEFLNLLDRR